MNIFSLLPRSFTAEAGGVAPGGSHAPSTEPGLVGEGILADSRKAFQELLSQGFLQEGEQQSPLGAQGKDLQGGLVEDLEVLKGSKVLESLEEIFSSEETLGILDVSDNLPFFEGTSLMLLREAALQYLQAPEASPQGEVAPGETSQGETEGLLPQGQNCKTEAELMALLATLERKSHAFPEPLSPEQGAPIQESPESLSRGQSEKTQQELMAFLSRWDRKVAPLQQDAPASELSGEITEEELLLPVSEIPEEKISQESLPSGNLPKEALPGKDLVSQENPGGETTIQEASLKKGVEMAGEKNSFPEKGEENPSVKAEKSAGEIPLFGEPSEEEGAPRLLSGSPAGSPEALLPEKEPAKQPSVLQEVESRFSRSSLMDQAVQGSGLPSSVAEKGEPLLNRGAASPESPQAGSSEGLPRILPVEEGGEGSRGKGFQDSQKFLFSPKNGESRETFSSRDAGEKPSFEQQLESRAGGEQPMASASQPSGRAESSAPSGSYTLPQRGLPALGEGVAATVRMVRTSQGDRAQIIVEPPALGRVSISLQSTDQGMSAVLRVDNEGLRQLLQSQMDLLRSSLQQQGVTVTSLSVDVRQGGDQASSGGNPREDQASRRRTQGIPGSYDLEGEESLPTYQLDMERGLLSWTA